MGAGGVGAHPGVREVDGSADLSEEADGAGTQERLIKLVLGEDAQEGSYVGEAPEVGPGVRDAVCGDVEELIAWRKDAHGEAEGGDAGEGGCGEDAIGGVETIVEETPVQVKLEAGFGVQEGEVFPEGDVGGEAARAKAAAGVGELVAEAGEEFDLRGETIGTGQQVDIADMAGVGAAEEDLRERHAFEDGEIQAGFGEGCGDAAHFGGGTERLEGVGLGAGLQRFKDGRGQSLRADAVQRLEDEGTEAVVRGDGEEVVPIDGRRGVGRLTEGKDLPGLMRGAVRARGEKHELNVAGKIAKRQHEPSLLQTVESRVPV